MPADLISEALVLPPHVPTYLDPPYGIDDFAHSVWGSRPRARASNNATAGVLESALLYVPTPQPIVLRLWPC